MREKWSYRCQYIRCGKRGCKGCPHGPYWYGFRSVNGRTQSKYFGKEDPRFSEKGRNASSQESGSHKNKHRYDDILMSSTASSKLAREILGLGDYCDGREAKAAFRRLTKEKHPDRGGDHRDFVWVSAAWSYLQKLYGW